ncbi:MAG: Flp family type IVb pilin [Caldilineaceae bacterium]|jgi:pilus assembly protein Flp/PilA
MFTKMMVSLNAYVAGLRKEEGQGLAEYALIIVLVSIAVVVALTAVGDDIEAVFESISTELGKTGA